HLRRVGHQVRLWARDPDLAVDLATRRANPVYLPDVTLPAGVDVTHVLAQAVADADLIVLAIPSHGCRAVVRAAARHMASGVVLVGTCTGTLSRNRHVGIELARGRSLADILAGMKMIAEGVRTTGAALALGARYGVELPIATQMAEVLAGRTDVRTALDALMLRRQRSETESALPSGH